MSKAPMARMVLVAAALAAMLSATVAWSTPGSGTTSTLISRATFHDAISVRRGSTSAATTPDPFEAIGGGVQVNGGWVPKDHPLAALANTSGDWQVEVQARPQLDIAVQTIAFPAGSHSGWHSHPGPVFISVVEGTMTFYESDDPGCTPIIRVAGEGYLDTGAHAHIARNESGRPARNVVTYFAPPASALRIDEPDPGNCPF